MGVPMLPDELLLAIHDQWPCRELQLKQLAALTSPNLPSPSTIVVYGPHATGKSAILGDYLQARRLQHSIVRCQECVTGRHLLEQAVASVHQSLSSDQTNGESSAFNSRCENLSVLVNRLQHLLANISGKYVLAFDGIDRQREAPPTLFPALARLGEIVPNLTVVLVLQHPSPRFLYRPGVPHIEFPAYSRAQSIHILSRQPPDIFLEPPPPEMGYDDDVHEEDKAWLWPRFCAAVWDSLGQQVARDLEAFRDVCLKLWRPFVQPIVKGDFGTRDFSRLVVAQRRLFQDEAVFADSLIAKPVDMLQGVSAKSRTQELPYYAKWLLIAAYLASFNPRRMDALFFMKATERRRRKKGGGTRATPNKPSQQRKTARHLLSPSPFPLDRLLSILHAILPDDIRTDIDIYTQVATLGSLRLLVKSAGIGAGDPLEPGAKWRVGPAVSWEYAQALSRSLDFGLIDYLAE